jgi:ABC-2 type transport system permease protein
MAVYEHSYKPYAGALTPNWSRFLVLPRYAYESVFKSKLAVGFFAACYLCPLIMLIIIYLHHNVSALAALQLRVSDLLEINASYFRFLVTFQGGLGFVFTVLVGPPLISRDLANNALPLYLCRPFSRAEYVLGKLSVLVILLSAITWMPGLLLFAFQASLAGGEWLSENLWLAWAIVASSGVGIIVLSLLALALSAWIKWRMAASGALFILFTIPFGMGMAINELFHTRWGHLINLDVLIQTVADGLFRQPNSMDFPNWMVLPLWAAWLALGFICAICLLLLARKVRAYEVVT